MQSLTATALHERVLCPDCGNETAADGSFCETCSADLHGDPPGTSARGPRLEADPALVWDAAIPLLTSRFMLWDFARVVVLSLVATQVLIGSATYLIGGDLWFIPMPIAALIGAGIVVLLALVALGVYRNRFHATFTVSPDGVGFASGDRERSLNRLALLGGLLSGRPSAAGAGMLAYAREDVHYDWEDVHEVNVYPDAQVISLRNAWRTLIRLHCPPEVFDEAVALCEAFVGRAAVERKRAAAVPQRATTRSYPVLALWVGVALLATFATQAMFYISSETLRLALAGGVLVVLAGILTGIPMLLSVPVAFIVNAWLVIATFDAVSPYTETGEFMTSAGGALLLAAMTVARPFVQPLNPKDAQAS